MILDLDLDSKDLKFVHLLIQDSNLTCLKVCCFTRLYVNEMTLFSIDLDLLESRREAVRLDLDLILSYH